MNIQQALIGSILNTENLAERILPEILPEYFTDTKCAEIFGIISRLSKSGVKISIMTVSEHYRDVTYLITCVNQVVSVAHVDNWIRMLKMDWLRRKILVTTGAEIGPFSDPEEYLTEYVKKLQGYLDQVVDPIDRTLEQMTDEALESLFQNKKGLPVYIQDLYELDPFHGGRLVILGGRPSHGKTALALSIAKCNLERGKRVLIFSLEMQDYELIKRILYTYDNPEIGAGEILKWPFIVIDKGGIGVDFIKSQIIKNKPELVIIDYLGLIKLPRGEKRTYQIGDISHQLKNLAKEFGIPILTLAQSNREVEERPDKIHRMSDLADSADIERDADFVMFVTRPELFKQTVYPDNIKTENTAMIQVVKNRHGLVKNIRVRTNKTLTQWYNFNDDPF